MLKILSLSLISFSFLFAETTEKKIEKFLPKFEQYVQKNMLTWAIPGLSIVIVTPNKILFCDGFGTREVGKLKPVNKNTIFQIASLTKNFTAALSGILENKKLFSLQDPVKKYIPQFNLANKDVAEKATLQDLISHRIGLDHFAGDSLMKFGFLPKQIIEKFPLIMFEQQFRKDYSYSNQMFGFMGIVMESVSGKSYEQLLAEYIFNPLKMTRSSVGKTLIHQHESILNWIKGLFGKDENIALYHDKNSEGQAVCIGLDPLVYIFPSTSGVNTTAHDFGIWLQCQLNDGKFDDVQIIPDTHVQAMRHPTVYHTKIKPHDMQFPPERMKNVGYGMGLFRYDYGVEENTIQVFEHMGGYAGQRSFMFMSPAQGFAVGIFSNLGHFNLNLFPEALRNVFLDAFLGLEDRNWSEEYYQKKQQYSEKIRNNRINKKLSSPAPKKADKFYIGTYYNELYGEIKIITIDNHLALSANGKTCSMAHWNGNEFSLSGWEFNGNMSRTDPHFIEFGTNEKGETLAYISFLNEGNDPIFVKKSS